MSYITVTEMPITQLNSIFEKAIEKVAFPAERIEISSLVYFLQIIPVSIGEYSPQNSPGKRFISIGMFIRSDTVTILVWHYIFICSLVFLRSFIQTLLKILHVQQDDLSEDFATSESRSQGSTRRDFLGQLTLAGVGYTIAPLVAKAMPEEIKQIMGGPKSQIMTTSIIINGKKRTLSIDARVTLLDALRENLAMTGTKKGCDRGQCGACTVLVNGIRINSCLTLAAMCNNKEVTTVEGLAKGDKLHPMQEAFIKHDAFQCGYCTPGQICSAVGLINEGHAKTVADIHEQMSGNICRCGAYRNIVNAIKEVGNI